MFTTDTGAWRDVYPDAGYTLLRATAAYFDKIWPLTDIERVKLTRERTSPVGTNAKCTRAHRTSGY